MNGKSLPGLENAIALARAVGLSLDYLADDAIESDPKLPKEPHNEMETMILRLARDLGYMEAYHMLQSTRIIGYDVAANRLLEGKPTITPMTESGRTGTTPASGTGRANTG